MLVAANAKVGWIYWIDSSSGWLMNRISYDALFPYSFVFITLAFVTMHFVRHGDSKVIGKRGLEAFDTDD